MLFIDRHTKEKINVSRERFISSVPSMLFANIWLSQMLRYFAVEDCYILSNRSGLDILFVFLLADLHH